MAIWKTLTPALFTIADIYGKEVCEGRWDDLIVPLLKNEKEIYDKVLEAIVVNPRSGEQGLATFWTLLPSGVLPPDNANDKLIPREVFYKYRSLAQSIDFWQPGHYKEYKMHIAYNDALLCWTNLEESQLQNFKRSNPWLITN